MAKLTVTPPAEADFNQISDHLSNVAGRNVARQYSADFISTYQHLAAFPMYGAPRPGLGSQVRIWTVEPYVVFYRYSAADDVVRILRILHGKRKVTAKHLQSGGK